MTDTYTFMLHLEGSYEFELDVTSIVPLTGTITQTYTGDWIEDEARQDITLTYRNSDQKNWDITLLTETNMTAEIIEADNKRYQVKFQRQ